MNDQTLDRFPAAARLDDGLAVDAQRQPAFPLTRIRPGETVRLVRLLVTGSTALRLAEMGFVSGAVLNVLRCQPGQPLLLAIGDSRLAVDRALAEQTQVVQLEGGRATRGEAASEQAHRRRQRCCRHARP